MNSILYRIFLFYAVTAILCAAASCPCHIPCTGKPEICTCFGPPGDDGYGCKSNGDEYSFLSQTKSADSQWTVQCSRKSTCSKRSLLDDGNPFAAYELRNNILQSFDNDERGDVHSAQSSRQSSAKWFGGNWFDFWGQNGDQFLAHQDKIDTLDDESDDAFTIASKHSGKHSKSTNLKDLGHNEAGYQIVAVPLYLLILCICGAVIIGMLTCAGFVYCGFNCCCPLPPSSPSINSQRTTNIHLNALKLLTLGHGKQFDSDIGQFGVYHRMRNALHNPSQNEEHSIASNDPHDLDEYVDSEDNQSRVHQVTRGNLSDEIKEEERLFREDPFSLREPCDSDIDRESTRSRSTGSGSIQVISEPTERTEQSVSILDEIADDEDRRIAEADIVYSERKEELQEGINENGMVIEEEDPRGNGIQLGQNGDPYGLLHVLPINDPDIVCSGDEGTPLKDDTEKDVM